MASKSKSTTDKDSSKKRTPGAKADSSESKPNESKPRKSTKKTLGASGAGKDKKGRKSNPRNKISAPAVVAPEGAGTKNVDPFEVAKQTVKGSVPAIVEAMVELAKQGSCTHAKTLLEMTGANRMFDGEAEKQDSGEPWAKLVLERLDEEELAESQENASSAREPLEADTVGRER